MDRFVYNYHTLGGQPSNRLNYVVDNGTDYSSYDDIKTGQATGNYTYNKIGELIGDAQEDLQLEWRTGDHKLSRIIRTDQDSPQIEFFYTAFGQRAMKVEKPRVSGVIQSASNWKYTYYAYDANGQVMAVYTGNFQGSSEQVKLSEQHLYGVERLGMINRDIVVFDNGVTSYTHKEEDVVHGDERGFKRYELLGHTNSVLAVISDRKMYNSVDGNYEPVLISWADYYAFGMLQSGRHGSATSELYRYLFQSMETDRGISGEGNSYTTEFRQYDPRLGRWKSLDPLMAKYPMMSPYVAFNNNPIFFTDPLGLEGGPAKEKYVVSSPTVNDLGGWQAEDQERLPTSGLDKGDIIQIMFEPKNKKFVKGESQGYSYTYQGDGKYRKLALSYGQRHTDLGTVEAHGESMEEFDAWMKQKSVEGGALLADRREIRSNAANESMNSSTANTIGVKPTVNNPRSENVQQSSDPIINDWAGATGGAMTTAEIVRNAKSVEQTGSLAGTVDKAAKEGKIVMNGKTYSSGYSGGRWHSTQSVKAAKVASKTIATVGRVLPIVGAVASIVEYGTGPQKTIDNVKLGLDLAMTTISVAFPGVGTVISGVYFVSRIFW